MMKPGQINTDHSLTLKYKPINTRSILSLPVRTRSAAEETKKICSGLKSELWSQSINQSVMTVLGERHNQRAVRKATSQHSISDTDRTEEKQTEGTEAHECQKHGKQADVARRRALASDAVSESPAGKVTKGSVVAQTNVRTPGIMLKLTG